MKKIQTSTATKAFREIDTIALAKKNLGNSDNLNILSFGCSIGDELATLRTFFPKATIHGCDIDPIALAKAQETTGHLANVFLSSEQEITARGPFDLICAFSSLCINPLPPLNLFLQQFPYTQFNDLIELLDSHLRPDGILAIKNASYPFVSTSVARRYHRLRSNQICQNGFIPTINPNGNIALASIVAAPPPATLFKIQDTTNLQDWDFIDSAFKKTRSPGDPTEIITNNIQTTDTEQMSLTAQWHRSNFDFEGVNVNKEKENYINFTTHYETFISQQFPEKALVRQTTLRSSITSPTENIEFISESWINLI